MRLILFTVILCARIVNVDAQCLADAGNDKILCSQDTNAVILGGYPSASFGTPPYSYKWFITPYFLWPVNITASLILNDTTLSNPTIIDPSVIYGDTVTFYLQVTDSLGCTSLDSCKVYGTQYAFSLGVIYYTINKGDSIFLNNGINILGGTGNRDFLWRPNHGLKDSVLETGFWSKPDSSINYYVTVTDELGCVAAGPEFYFITVNQIGIDENELNNQVKVFPNPTKDLVYITSKDLRIRGMSICNLIGQVLYSSNRFQEQIDISKLSNGMYILILNTDKGIIRKKLKKE
jgi:hypothetical protein